MKVSKDSEPRHSTDFRTIFGIMIGWFVSCEIGQTYFTESRGSFGTLQHPDFKSLSSSFGLNPHFSDPGHRSDFKTVFKITIPPFVSCQIRKTYFTESIAECLFFNTVVFLCSNMLPSPWFDDSQGGKWDVKCAPKGQGSARGVHGVKGDVRGVQGGSGGVRGATRYPRGSRTALEVSQGSREV